ncbi:MAG: FtsX-like permease family protein, partial [Candidatus Methylumidiphilus sp.]
MRETAPAIEGYVSLNDSTLRLAGFDPFSERNLRSRFVKAAKGDDAVRLLTEPDTVMLSALTAQRLGVRPGASLDIKINGQSHRIKVIGLIEGDATPDPALEGLMLADIATVQELLGRVGVLDRIDLILPVDPERERQIRKLLPPGVELESAAGRNSATQNMTAAFELNLRAMSLLALLVGTFLIYNTMAFSVLQRRELLATLRILGATRGQLLWEILSEAALLGLLGGLLGLAFGLLAAQGLLQMVTRTINDLYFVLTVTEFMLDPMILLRGLALGIAAAVIAALGPALEAAWATPLASRARSGVENTARRGLPWLAASGVLFMVAALVLLESDRSGLISAIAGVFLLLLGYGLLAPWLLLVFAALTTRLAHLTNGWLLRLAVRGVAASVSRAGLAIAALTIAVAVSIGVGTMIESFRGTIGEWLEQILQADIYVAAPSTAARHSPPLPVGLPEKLSQLAGVDKTGTGRRIIISTSKGE